MSAVFQLCLCFQFLDHRFNNHTFSQPHLTPIDADMFFIKMFERTIPTLMEGNDYGQDLTVV